MHAEETPQLAELVDDEVARQRRLFLRAATRRDLFALLPADRHAAVALEQHAYVVAAVAHSHHHLLARLLHVVNDVRLEVTSPDSQYLLLGRDSVADRGLALHRVGEELLGRRR